MCGLCKQLRIVNQRHGQKWNYSFFVDCENPQLGDNFYFLREFVTHAHLGNAGCQWHPSAARWMTSAPSFWSLPMDGPIRRHPLEVGRQPGDRDSSGRSRPFPNGFTKKTSTRVTCPPSLVFPLSKNNSSSTANVIRLWNWKFQMKQIFKNSVNIRFEFDQHLIKLQITKVKKKILKK